MATPYTQGQQHQNAAATTVIASAALAANRFIAYDGGYAPLPAAPKTARASASTLLLLVRP